MKTDVNQLTNINEASFMEMAQTAEGLAQLSIAIEKGELSESKAMEAAMYSVAYAMSRFQIAHDLMLEFLRSEDESLKQRELATQKMKEAMEYAKSVRDCFSEYLSIKTTLDSLYSIFYFYDAMVLIPTYFEAARSNSRNKTVKTYFFKNPITGLIKIGRTIDVKTRKQSVQCGAGIELFVIAVIEGDIENELHKQFADYREHGEWFNDANGLIEKYALQHNNKEIV